MRVICAWCQLVLQDGTVPASHGMCKACQTKIERLMEMVPHDPRD